MPRTQQKIDTTATDPPSYEAALAELEQISAAMEGGQMPLDQLLARHQRGMRLLAFCRDRLKAVEDQVKVLEGGTLGTWADS
jgi:exodeoxyribonuclease VII small subunit